jgi:hypothetical protein
LGGVLRPATYPSTVVGRGLWRNSLEPTPQRLGAWSPSACCHWRANGWGGSLSSTKLAAGLRSAARNNKATRLLTRPGLTTKSSAKDLILRTVKLQSASWRPRIPRGRPRRPAEVLGRRPIRIRLQCAGEHSPRSGMDSDLEAFSHNPADGSFAAMPGQTAAKTNYLNPRFLSY